MNTHHPPFPLRPRRLERHDGIGHMRYRHIGGGGLAGGLLALALQTKRPELRVLLIEQDAHFGGNHIWSFFGSDIAPEHRALVEPLIVHSWQGYDVHFPAHSRQLGGTYNSITSERLGRGAARAAATRTRA